ncbi:GLUG motif-containing protein, partial [Candidatus Omnitrophota bacterium]
GGLVGQNLASSITTSYATGDVAGNEHVGGLVGSHEGGSPITNSYATGSVTGISKVGGLVGKNDGSFVTNSYATGVVTGDLEGAGGLVGFNSGNITNSYSIGDVNSGDDSGQVGGLIGWMSDGAMTHCWWSNQTNSNGVGFGRGNAKRAASAEAFDDKTQGVYDQGEPNAWDFVNTWNIVENKTHPYLSWQTLVSGRVYSDLGVTPINDPVDVTVAMEGMEMRTKSTDGEGFYNIPVGYSTSYDTVRVLVYTDKAVLEGNTLTMSGVGEDIEGLDIYANTVIARHENAGPVTEMKSLTLKTLAKR